MANKRHETRAAQFRTPTAPEGEPVAITVEIRRYRMAGGGDRPGQVDVGYDFYVAPGDALPGADLGLGRVLLSTHGVPGFREVVQFDRATWVTDLAPGWDRYEAWLAQEKRARGFLLALLKEHCPETQHADRFPLLWLDVSAADLPDGFHRDELRVKARTRHLRATRRPRQVVVGDIGMAVRAFGGGR